MQLNIRKKILFSYTISVAVGGLIWILSYYYHNDVSRELRIIEEKDYIFNDILEARRYEKNYFLTTHPDHIDQAFLYATNAQHRMQNIVALYAKYPVPDNLRKWLTDIKAYKTSLLTLQTLHREADPARNSGKSRDALRVQHTELHLLGRKMTANIEKAVNRENKYVQRLISKSKTYHFITLAALFVLASLTALFIIFDVNRPLKYIENAIRKITQGDYTVMPEISTGDEFESLVHSLNDMIRELNRRSDQMLQTEKLASLGILTSGVAHELNNPLSNISTSVQIMQEELEDGNWEFKRELLSETINEVDRARDTVKALLEFSREGPYKPQEVDFGKLVGKTIKLVKSEVPADVEIVVEVSEPAFAYVCSNRIQQLLIILILNGVQAMENGGGVLTLRACAREARNEFIIQVSDTGPGIPAEILPKIFDPFFTTKDVGKGSGLGLSIAHGIVEQHCGRIKIDTAENQGTTFTIVLPA